MPAIGSDIPRALKPYMFHGLDLQYKDGQQAVCECPFCGRAKFYVHPDSGLWQCRVCQTGSSKGGGNIYTFLRALHAAGPPAKPEVAAARKLKPETLAAWGVVTSVITGEALVPGYGPDGKLNQLYRYAYNREAGKHLLLATTDLHHQLHGMNLWDAKKPTVYVCEGPWDGMALWETLNTVKVVDGRPVLTGNPAASLGAGANVIAVPGCNVFDPKWAAALGGKRVALMYDNDYPKFNRASGKELPPAGLAGMKRAAGILGQATEPPAEITYLHWGDGGFTRNYPDGFDARDFVTAVTSPGERAAAAHRLVGMCRPIPGDWVAGRTGEAVKAGRVEMELIPCDSWRTLTTQFRKAMKWTDGLDGALSFMLAIVACTKAVGDQLWGKVMGPPSCGKTSLCEALSACRKYVYPKDTMTGIVSGYQSDAAGSENVSMVKQMNGKTLIIKDADTVLQNPALPTILSQFRAFYDRSIRTQYGNKMSSDHDGMSTSVIICGTAALRALDASELGARFLDWVIMDKVDEDLEDEILDRIIQRRRRTLGMSVNGSAESQTDPETTRAMQLAGGYVAYLRDNADRLLGGLDIPPGVDTKCKAYGKFIAYMRARPSKRQDEVETEREFAGRLVSQLYALATGTAVAMGKTVVDDEVMRRVRKVTLDTSAGRSLNMVKVLAGNPAGMDIRGVSLAVNDSEDKCRTLLRFLRKIGVVEMHQTRLTPGLAGKPKWVLATRVAALYREVVGGDTSGEG